MTAIFIGLILTAWPFALLWAFTIDTIHGPRKLVPPLPTRFESELEAMYRAPSAKGRYR